MEKSISTMQKGWVVSNYSTESVSRWDYNVSSTLVCVFSDHYLEEQENQYLEKYTLIILKPMLCTTKTKLFISILLLLAGCVNNDSTSIFYYSISLEEDGEISSYDQLTKSISGDTLKFEYKSYDSSTHELIGKYRNVFRMKNDSIFWIRRKNKYIENINENQLFSSFVEGKCDTAYFEYEKIINCYKGKHNLNIKGKMYNNAHLFYKENWSVYNDLFMTKIYYDKDLVPILIECIEPKSHVLRIERVDNMPFKPIN